MAKQLHSNNGKGRLASPVGPADTSLTLNAAQGTTFPNPANGDWFRFTLIKADGSIEVCRCTARSGDTFSTIVRAQEGTSALTLASNDRVEGRVTAGLLDWFRQRGEVVSVGGNKTLLTNEFPSTQLVTAAADLTLPAASSLADQDDVDLKSQTTSQVRVLPAGADLIDGVNAAFIVPINGHIRIRRVSTTAFVVLSKPQVGKQALPVPVLAMIPRQTNGCAALSVDVGATDQPDVPYLAFDAAVNEYAGFAIRMPKGWNRGAVTAAFSWARASGTSALNAVWGIRAVAVGDADSFAANFSAGVTVTDAAPATDQLVAISAETPALTIAATWSRTTR